jgi:chitodextrinase
MNKRNYTIWSVLLCLFGFLSSIFAQTPYTSAKKKLIEFGWDIPNYDFVADNITAMEYAPFDGVVFDMRIPKRPGIRRSWSVCNPDEVKEIDFDFTKLPKISSNKLTDNFIRVFMQDDYDQSKFGWFNDTIWTNIQKSTKLLSKAVKLSKSKGIFLDTEEYGGLQNPWEYSTTIYPNQSSQQVYDKVRQRGREYMIELQSDMPNVKVLYSFAYDFIENWGNGSYYAQKYALLKPFLDGMLEAAGPQVILIDGNEATYFTDKNEDHTWWYDQVKVQYLKDRIPAELISKYKSHYRVGSSPIVNRYFDIPYGQAGYDFNFDLTLDTQKKWLEHGIYNRLMMSDEYVWTWSQGDVNWWNGSNFKNKQEWINAVVNAKNKLTNGQAMGYTMGYAGNELKADLSYSTVVASLTSPAHNAVIPAGEITFKVQFNDATKNNYQYFYINGISRGYTLSDTAKIKLTDGIYTAFVFGYDKDNKSYQSNPVTFTVGNPAAADTQAPTAPSNLSSSNIATTSFTTSWTASTDNVGVKSYDIFSNGSFVANTTNLSYNFTNQTPSTTYSITIKAKDAAGNSSVASSALNVKTLDVVNTTDTQTPTAPSNLSSSNITTTSFTTSWTASTDNVGVKSYDIFSNGSFVANTTNLSYNFTNQTPNTTYSITIKAKDAAGNTSVASSALNVKTLQTTTSGDSQAPTPPNYIAVSTITETSFILYWSGATDNVGVISYEIYLNNILFKTTDLTYLTLTGLTKGTDYNVVIKAKDAAGNISIGSKITNVKTLGGTVSDTTPPSAPTYVAPSSITETSFLLFWSGAYDNIGVTYYEIYLNDAFVNTTNLTYLTLSNLAKGTNYKVTIKAKDAAGNVSLFSSPITVKTLGTAIVIVTDIEKPSTPLNLKSSNVTTNSFLLSWLASTDNVKVTKYQIFQNNKQIAEVDATVLSLNITGLVENTYYAMNVRCSDAAGNKSNVSTTLNVKTVSGTNLINNLITFSDQAGGSIALNPSIYKNVDGKNTTATFTGFNAYDGAAVPLVFEDKSISGNNRMARSVAATSVVTFSSPVILPSFWVNILGSGKNYGWYLTGSLNGASQFTYSFYNSSTKAQWIEIANGKGLPIDKLTIYNANGCAIDDLKIEPATTTIARISNKAIVSPNPINDYANVTFFNENKTTTATIILTDFNGRIQSTQKIETQIGENNFQLDVNLVPNGLYILQILRAESNESLKIQIQH